MADDKRAVPYAQVDLEAVRTYVQGRADETSVRAVAGLIGMGHTSLVKFLDGSDPYNKNRVKLCEFYLRQHPTHPVKAPFAADDAEPAKDPGAHLDALLSELRGEARTDARQKITNALADGYRRMSIRPPSWLYPQR